MSELEGVLWRRRQVAAPRGAVERLDLDASEDAGSGVGTPP
ncbi:hypothetical protein [Streptomyces sp. NPDC023588]